MRKVILYLLLITSSSLSAQQIIEYEYWFDGDFANKLNTTLGSPSNDVTISFDASTSSLQDGFHFLNTRFKQSDNLWSPVQTDYFIKTTATGGTLNEIVAYEYWFDDGYASKTSQNLSVPAEDATIMTSIDVNTLTDGLHFLNIRMQDASGRWSPVQSDYFIKSTATGSSVNEIVAYEYWFDDEYASKVSENLSAPTEDATITTSIDVNALTDGFHFLNIRMQDASGKWSPVQSDYFIKTDALGGATNQIVAYEYWFDDEYASKVSENLSAPTEDATITTSIDVNALTDGFHFLNIRMQDATGSWSPVQTDYFIKSVASGGATNEVLAYEYWFDNDFSGRISENTTTPAVDVTILDSFSLSGLTQGYHYVNVRFWDATGKWSPVQSDLFKYCSNYYGAPVISGDTVVCENSTLNLTAASSEPLTTEYFWSGPNNFTHTGANLSIANITDNEAGTYSCYSTKGSTLCDTSQIASVEVSVILFPESASTISGTATVCQGETSVNYTVPTIANATSYVWSLPSGATGTSTTNSIDVDFGTAAVSGDVTVYGTNSCGDGTSSSFSVTVNPLPDAAGTIAGVATVCQGATSVTYTVPTIANATSYVWTLPSGATGTSTTNSIDVDYGVAAISGDITVYGTNSCGDGTSSLFSVTVNPLPDAAGTIAGDVTVCQGANSITYTVPTISNATSYVWTLPSGATGTSTTNSIDVDFGTAAVSGDVTVHGTNSCGDGASSSFSVTVNPLPDAAGTIAGNATVCQGATSVTYTVPTIANATSYVWTLPSGATGTSTTNSIDVDFGITAVSGDITVYGTNNCDDGTSSLFSVTVNPLPDAAGTIAGDVTVCQGANSITYTVPTISNATSYVWTLPSGATGTSTTNSIDVDFGTAAVSGDVTVHGTNSCGDGASSSFSVTVNPLPDAAGTIAGNATVCQGATSVTYTVPTIANATSYVWTLPSGATGTSTTNSIDVDFGITAVSGDITVYGTNNCDDGTSSLFSVTVNPLPDAAGTIAGDATVCQEATSVIYTVPTIANATSYVWTLPSGATGTSTTNSIDVDYGVTAVSGDITVYGTNSCGDGIVSTLAVTVNLTPDAAGTISGTATVCQGETSVNYTVPTIANTTSYVWSLPSGATGTSTTNSIDVDFGTAAVSGDVTVYGTNSCDDGTSSSFSVTVNPLPDAAGTIAGDATVCQEATSVIYTVPTIANATSYVWTLPSGATGTSTTNSIDVDYGVTAVSGDITVYGTNSCGDGIVSTLAVTVNPLPDAAGTIAGDVTVCQGANSITYTVPTISNATSYVWTLPSGATGSSTTNSIDVDFGVTAVSGDITVYGTNSCGDGIVSTLAVTVNLTPDAAGTIAGDATVCQEATSVTYTVPTIANATSYVWTLPSGATGTSTTNSIDVDFGITAVSGDITVYGTNNCDDGAVSTLAVTVNSIPPTPSITIDGNVLTSDAATGNQWYDQDGLIPGADNQEYIVTEDGDYYVIVTLAGCSSTPSNTINATVSGIELLESDNKIKVYPNPVLNELIIEFNSNTERVNFEILNSIGEVVFKGYLFEKRTVETSTFAPGIYFIKLENKDSFELKKIVKK